MKALCRRLCLCALLLGLLAAWPSGPARAQSSFAWSPAAPSPVERFEGPAVVSGGKAYVFGGFADGLVAQARSDVYDPATDTWTRLADLPVANTHVGIAAAGGKIYLAGGFVGDHPGTATDAVYVYDIETDTFAEGPPLPAARAGGALVHHLGKLHHIGGVLPDRRTDATDHYVLDLDDPAAGWATAAPLPQGRNHFNGVSLGGRIWAVGGQVGHDGPNDDVRTLSAYDPATDAWAQMADLPEDRSHAEPGTFVWNGRIVIAGGKSDGTGAIKSVRAYDPASNTWSALGDLPASLRAPVAQVIGNVFVVTTGGSGGGINAESETWTADVGTAPRLLFVRGGDRTGGFLEAGNDAERTEHLADVFNTTTGNRNHGWGFLRAALEADGFVVEQVTEGVENASGPADGIALDFEQMDLQAYDALVLGSNNAVYDAAAVDAVEQYVRGGGSVLFISDANFGSDWADAPDSDQQFLDRFGLVMNQDHGTYALARADGDFLVPDHPIFEGVSAFGGEGVSPIALGEGGAAATVLARAKGQTRVNAPPFGNNRQGAKRAVNASDAALLVAEAGAGRIAGHFDRNTFFNPGGAGGDLTQFDNERYALNLFRWLAAREGEEEPPPPPVGDVPAAGQTIWLRAVNGKLVAAQSATAPLIASGNTLGLNDKYEVVDAGQGSGVVCLRSLRTGQFVAAEQAGAEPLIANRNWCRAWERFEFVEAGGGAVGLRALVNGKFVAAESAGSEPLIANRDWLREWETFAWGVAEDGAGPDALAAEQEAEQLLQQQLRQAGEGALPAAFALEGNYPNPFSGRTTIRYALPEAADVTLEVYDVLGRRVAVPVDGRRQEAGYREAAFDAGGLSSGVYVVRLRAEGAATGDFAATAKVTVVR